MAIRKSILLMSNTGTNWNVYGEPERANAYYGYTNGVITTQVVYSNFVGGFGIQGTLALRPGPEDWFWININNQGNSNTPYLTYPIVPLAPTGANGGDTGSMAFSFIGNFTFIRAVLTREYIQPMLQPDKAQWETWVNGSIDRVLMTL